MRCLACASMACGSPRLIAFDGMTKLCAAMACSTVSMAGSSLTFTLARLAASRAYNMSRATTTATGWPKNCTVPSAKNGSSCTMGPQLFSRGRSREYNCGPIVHDDPFLADGTVQFLGQPVAVVVARDMLYAREAAKRASVKVKE